MPYALGHPDCSVYKGTGVQRYYYNPKTEECYPFIYAGCGFKGFTESSLGSRPDMSYYQCQEVCKKEYQKMRRKFEKKHGLVPTGPTPMTTTPEPESEMDADCYPPDWKFGCLIDTFPLRLKDEPAISFNAGSGAGAPLRAASNPNSACFKLKAERERLNSAGNDVHHVPDCREDGTFSERQCHNSKRVCWCVTEDGKEIRGSRAPFISGWPVCSLQVYSRTGEQRYYYNPGTMKCHAFTYAGCGYEGLYTEYHCRKYCQAVHVKKKAEREKKLEGRIPL